MWSDVTLRLLSIILESSWQSAQVADQFLITGKLGRAEGKKENPSKHRSVSLISVLGKVMEQICLETISKETEGRRGFGAAILDLQRANCS